jgi:hypothetical protein
MEKSRAFKFLIAIEANVYMIETSVVSSDSKDPWLQLQVLFYSACTETVYVEQLALKLWDAQVTQIQKG